MFYFFTTRSALILLPIGFIDIYSEKRKPRIHFETFGDLSEDVKMPLKPFENKVSSLPSAFRCGSTYQPNMAKYVAQRVINFAKSWGRNRRE